MSVDHERRSKMVLVCRRLFPDVGGGQRKLRTGKYVAQACHAAVGLILRDIQIQPNPSMGAFNPPAFAPRPAVWHWIRHSYRKVCVYVDTAEELIVLKEKAQMAGVNHCLIEDNGDTEFDGKPTITVLGLGPDWDEVLDELTGHLPLF